MIFTKLNLGCGGFPIAGWGNLDLIDHPGVMRWDLSRGVPQQFEDMGVSHIFSEHFLEHLTREQALSLLKSCRRALGMGGVIRIGVPDLEYLVQKYQAKDLDWGGPGGWCPATPAQMMNEGMTAWGHRFMYDEAELRAILFEAGFPKNLIARRQFGESSEPAFRGIELRSSPYDLRLEARI